MFQVKAGCALNCYWYQTMTCNTNLILNLASSLVSTKGREGAAFPKIPMLTSYKCVTGIPSLNLFFVQAPVHEVLKNVLPIYYHRICM